MKLLAALPLIVLSGLALAQTKEKTMVLSWGDVIWQHRGEGVSQLDTPEKMRQAVRIWKKEGIQKVQFRLDSFRILLFHHLYVPADNPYVTDYHRGWSRMTRRAWDEGIVLTALEALKAEHIQVYGYFTIFDEGSPPETVLRERASGLGNRSSPERISTSSRATGASVSTTANIIGASWSMRIRKFANT